MAENIKKTAFENHLGEEKTESKLSLNPFLVLIL